MITEFERIPDLFVQLYDQTFQVWAREFKIRGPKCAIPFLKPPGAVTLLDANGHPMQKGAWFEAEVDRSLGEPRVVIRPATPADEELIARHVREMSPHVLQ
ncbi:MAG: hypothetical protein ABIO35_08205 [Nitrobacter sp.]